MLKVADVFFNEPTKMHYLVEISRNINLSHTSVKNYLIELKKQKIIREKLLIKGTRKFPYFKANINDSSYVYYKKLNNNLTLKKSGLIEFLRDKLMPKSIVLFGSYQKGQDIEDSDIDLFVECKEQDINVKSFEKKLNRKIQLHFKQNFSDYPEELKNNIVNGVVLYGYLEAFK